MNKPPLSVTPLPAGLLNTLRLATAADRMPAMAALDRKSREEITILARQFLVMLDQSATWRPNILETRIYLSVQGNGEAKVALGKLHSLGCDQYQATLSGTPVSAIFVDRQGRFTFLFDTDDRDRYFGQLSRDGEWHRIDMHQLLSASAIGQLQPQQG